MTHHQWATRGVLLGALAFAVSGCASKTVPANEAMAKEAFAKLGGKLSVDEKLLDRPDKPVVRVDFYGTRVGDAELKGIEFLPDLRELYVNETPVTDAGLKGLKKLKNLQKLDLGMTDITDAGLQELKELKNLQTLNLRYTRITDAGLAELKELDNLRTLYLSGTAVTDAGLMELKALKRLEFLDLQHTSITDAGLREFKDFPQLNSLDIGGAQVTDAGIKDLQATRPMNITRMNGHRYRVGSPARQFDTLYWAGGLGLVLILVGVYLVSRRRQSRRAAS